MADEADSSDKTEDPTQKRLDDAHEKGDVAKSQEVNTWFVIAGATLVLSSFSGSIGSGILMPLRNLVANSWMIQADGAGLLALGQSLGITLLAALGVPFLGAVPLLLDIRTTSDAGTPICAAAPDSPAAQAFAAIARRVWDSLPGSRAAAPRIVMD